TTKLKTTEEGVGGGFIPQSRLRDQQKAVDAVQLRLKQRETLLDLYRKSGEISSPALTPKNDPQSHLGTTPEALKKLTGLEVQPAPRTLLLEQCRGGLRVVSIRRDSPGARAGLHTDDVVIGADVWETLSVEHLWYALTKLGYVHSQPN